MSLNNLACIIEIQRAGTLFAFDDVWLGHLDFTTRNVVSMSDIFRHCLVILVIEKWSYFSSFVQPHGRGM